ncbi:MAG: pitrilysin family protein [Pseudomonadota bacterium]
MPRLFTAILLAACLSLEAALAAMPEVKLDYDRFVLPNGLTVIVHEDRKAPVVAVSVWYGVGSKDEPEGKTGFAHLFEHIMFNGSENYDKDYFGPFEEVGATGMNGTTWFDRTNYFQTVPTPALDLALWMESDRMGHLLGAVTQDKLDEQRDVVKNEKRQGDNQPYGTVWYRILEGVFPPGHPYRHSTIGSMEDLEAASLEDVKQWFKDYYGAANAVLVLAGDIDVETARPLVETYFGDIDAGPPVRKFEQWVPTYATDRKEVMRDRVPLPRSYAVWAVPGRSERDSALLTLAASVLGDGKNSRLYKELVYDRQTAQSVSASLQPLELASLFSISLTAKDEAVYAETVAGAEKVLKDFLAKGPTKAELARAKTKINASVIRGLEQVGGFGGKAVTLAEGELYEGDPGYFKTWLAWLNAAKPDDVRNAARTWLRKGAYELDVLPFADHGTSGGGADRSALPVVAETPDLVFPDLETATLSNGVKVVLARRDAVPVVEIAAQFDAGYAADTPDKLGAASFAMSMLDEGTSSRSALEIAAEVENLGAALYTDSSLDTSTAYLSALTVNLEASVMLMADILQNPAFEPAEIERLRTRWIASIGQEKASPVQLALRLLPPILYGEGHAYAAPFTGSGTEESIANLSRADLQAFHDAWIRPDNMSLFVVGDTSLNDITPILEKAFGKWRPQSVPMGTKSVADVAAPDKARVILIDKAGAPQSLILAGHVAPPSGADNAVAISAMNEIIGGQFSSRINMNLREEKGWAYGARTLLTGARGQRPFMVYAPVQTDKTAASMEEMYRELSEFKGPRPASETEMARAVLNNTRSLPGQFETADAVLGALLSSARYGRPLDYPATLTARYRALELSDVRAAAEDVVKPDSLTWIVVGDLDMIEQEIRDLGYGRVDIWTLDGVPAVE